MKIIKKDYYYSLYDFIDTTPFTQITMKSFLAFVLGIESDPPVFTGYQVPSDLGTNETIYNELMALIYGRYYKDYAVRISKYPGQSAPVEEDVIGAFTIWGYKFLSKLNMTYEYYVPLLTMYRNAKANLMDDITATTNNMVKFNDTPQNANNDSIYEGDNYITNFTKSSGTTSSPMMSKIMRLKEIQQHYKNVMADWVKEFERLFYTEDEGD